MNHRPFLKLLFVTVLSCCGGLSSSAAISLVLNGKGAESFNRVQLRSFFPGADTLAADSLRGQKALLQAAPAREGLYLLELSGSAQNYPVKVSTVLLLQAGDNSFSLNWDVASKRLSVEGSAGNQAFASLLQTSSGIGERAGILSECAAQYKRYNAALSKQENRMLSAIKDVQAEQQQQLEKLKQDFITAYPATVAAAYLAAPQELPTTAKAEFWGKLPLQDERLLFTPYYTALISRYASAFFQLTDSIQGPAQRKMFADELMDKFHTSSLHRQYMYLQLLAFFRQLQDEEAVKYLDGKYGKDIACQLSGLSKSEWEDRARCYEQLATGKPVPPLGFRYNGNEYNLKQVDGDTMILVFYSSHCAHCTEQLPKLDEWRYKGHERYQVLAINVDPDEEAHQQLSKRLPNLMHLLGSKETNGNPARDFCIAQTPTYLVLNGKRELLFKALETGAVFTFLDTGTTK